MKLLIFGRQTCPSPRLGWGVLHIEESSPYAGARWTDSGKDRDHRQLKHRAVGEGRPVSCPPELTEILHRHLAEHGADADGRLFWAERGGDLPAVTYQSMWRKVRERAFDIDVATRSPLAKRPYEAATTAAQHLSLGPGFRAATSVSASPEADRTVRNIRNSMCVMTFNDSSLPPVLPEDAASLVAAVTGSVLLPGDAGYDDERAVFNLNHHLVPAVIVVAESTADVQAAVAFAAGQHRPVLVKTTGHQMVGPAHGAVVIATRRMNDVAIDAVGRTARVGAGARWAEVVKKAAKAGLAPLNGSNPTVGVSGYTLGGGLSPTLGRSHGYAADHVRSLDVVTADGELRHINAQSEPDLFWALRGGKGNFGVVTALEFDLFPVPRLYGGGIYFPGERMADVLRAWTAWHPGTPETMISSFAVLRLRALPQLPESLYGEFVVHLRIAYNGTAADGERMVAPLRAVAPALLDTVADMPYTKVASIHNETTEPVPYYERSIMLREFPADALDKLVELSGSDSANTLTMVELRALGGAWDREAGGAQRRGDQGSAVRPAGCRGRSGVGGTAAQGVGRGAARRYGALAGRPTAGEQPRAGRGNRRRRDLRTGALYAPGGRQEDLRPDEHVPAQPQHRAYRLSGHWHPGGARRDRFVDPVRLHRLEFVESEAPTRA